MNTPWRELNGPEAVAERLVAVFEVFGESRYDEAVTQSVHAAQAAALAQESGAADSLVAAALLHDLGHLLGCADTEAQRDRDLHHEEVAARFLRRWFGPEVVEPIRHHVAAKRYLCAVDDGYHDTLSTASVHSLAIQGGVMMPSETAAFEQIPRWRDAAALRRWDDLAKDPDWSVPPVRSYLELLVEVGERRDDG
ncbi:phosphonate degradation HD-domain oxygenase [Ilumatobacter sp.]|uniref:phosphonate degradation HD-domain oxygenase n=1 Tax=Ilumatobacter sp. TaxID=1967498 RepID=UPI003C33279F